MRRLPYKILLSFLLCLCLWLLGLNWFIGQIPQAAVADDARADAIVVLTGGSGRLDYGMRLLQRDKGKQLFISGVHNEAMTPQSLVKQNNALPVRDTDIVLGRHAENTIGNAEETVRWLHKKGYKSILLVTASYHMPRAVQEFKDAAPDIAIIPAPVFPDNFTLSGWWRNTPSRLLLLSEYHKYMASRLRHWLITALRQS